MPDPRPRPPDVLHPIQAHRVAAAVGDRLQPGAAALREHDRGHRLALVLPVQVPHDLRDVRQREFAKRAIGQHAAPGIEQHDRLGSGPDLRVQVIGHRARIDREHPVHQVGPGVQHCLDGAKVLGAAALDHVTGERPGAAGKPDQRNATLQRGALPI